MVLLSKVCKVMVVGDHKYVDLCKADIEARMMIDLGCQML